MCMLASSTLCGSSHLKSLFLCFCLFPAYFTLGSSNCTHYYLSQPVREVTCNPYDPLNDVLHLECNTFGTGNYSVFWFHSIEGITQQLADAQDGIGIDPEPDGDFRHSQLRIDTTENNIIIGFYWCQIGLLQRENQSITIDFLEPSQRTLLLPMENYTDLPPCARRAELDESTVRCATDPLPEDVLIPLQSSRIPYWSYGLIAALAIALIIIIILLLVNLVACRRLKRTNKGLSKVHQPEIEGSDNIHPISKFPCNPQPPVAVSDQEQTLHIISLPIHDEQIDRCSAMYAEAGNEGVRPIDMPYTSLDQHSMDDPTIYTPTMNF